MTRLVRVLWLTVVWVALWADLSVANVLSGLLVGGAVVLAFDTWRPGRVIVRPVRAMKFTLYFVYQLAVSTLIVARTILSPRARLRMGIVAVPLQGCSDAVVTLVADAISLTPGTLTLEVGRDPMILYVHALDVRDISLLQHDVRKLERMAIEAFGDEDAIASLDLDDSTAWRSR
jgi:multicomponent Na+:H+ antiporter subunit E